MPEVVVSGISFGFPKLSRCEGQIAHVLLTRSPLEYSRRSLSARLACVRHAASVRPEPGSNSPRTGCENGLPHPRRNAERDRRPVSDHEGESATGRIWLTDLLSKAGAPTVSGPRAGGAGPPTWFPPPVEFPG